MKLIKINSEHFIIVDDSRLNQSDWMYLQYGRTPATKQGEIAKCKFPECDDENHGIIWKKITHSTQPLESYDGNWRFDKVQPLFISEVKELIGEVYVEKRFYDILNAETPQERDVMLLEATKHGFKYGYNQALEDNKDRKWTDADVIRIVEKSRETGLTAEYILLTLQPPTQWEVEFVDGKLKLK